MPLPAKPHQQSDIEQGQQVSEHQQSSEWIKVKYSGRKNLCEICDNIMAKYTCPKCQMKTCSLLCTRKHKEVKQCSGERQPVEYVSRDQIDEKVVSKDYNFIQDMISGADKVKKVLSGVNTTISMQPRRFKILRTNAKQLHNIRLSNGPNILQRHRDNISFFYVKDKSIYWVFQLMYYSAWHHNQMLTVKTLTQPISDSLKFVDVLPEGFLQRQLLEQKGINTTKRDDFSLFLQNKQKQNQWSASNQPQSSQVNKNKHIVFSSTIVSGKFTTLYELVQYDTQKTISEQMKDISVFQFPTLFVVHNSLKDEFLTGYKKSKAEKKEDQKGLREKGSERERSRDKAYHKKTKVQQDE